MKSHSGVARTVGTGRSQTPGAQGHLVHDLASVISLRELALESPRPGTQRSARILLVNADPVVLRQIDARLSGEGYWVAPVSSFELAKQLIHSAGADLLVADVRLEAFNGLHLAARSRVEHPGLPVIITHAWQDSVLEAEARSMGASFVVNPLENPDFLRQVRAVLDARPRVQPLVRRR